VQGIESGTVGVKSPAGKGMVAGADEQSTPFLAWGTGGTDSSTKPGDREELPGSLQRLKEMKLGEGITE